MFTVIICNETVINDCINKYKLHLIPLLENKNYAFCAWHPEGKTLKESVPDLEETIKMKKEWRAVVLADSHSNVLDYSKSNPFDCVDYKKADKKMCKNEQILEYRDYVENAAKKALSNPLMKLSVWLAGSAARIRPTAPKVDFMSVEPCSQEYHRVCKEYGCTVSDLEISLARAYRFDCISENFEMAGEVFNPPQAVIAVCERSFDTDLMRAESAWELHTEYDYSNFIDDNMYSSKMRCLIYDVPRVKGEMKESDYFKYLCTMLIISQNEIPSDVLKFGRVYEVNSVIDEAKMTELCNRYIAKLRVTLKKLSELKYFRQSEANKVINDAEAQREFEREILIPVALSDEFDEDTLMCEYKDIGLSRDCPIEEDLYWNQQSSTIKKRFNRFLRQPQRCVEKAVETEFRKGLDIDRNKAKHMTKYQRQDVLFKLYEEEQNMLETKTSNIYDKDKYYEVLDKADKFICRGISQRMTKKRTIIASLLALAVFIVGFIPMFIDATNSSVENISVSFIVALLTCVAIIICIIVMLFVFRKQLVNRFLHFNYEMRGIYSEITDSMDDFSKYLSHAVNVRREFEVLKNADNQQVDFLNVYKKHEIDIENNIISIMQLFSDYIDEDYICRFDEEPYYYDFDAPITYLYEIPYRENLTEIDFLQYENKIRIPINFIESVLIRREELYA